MNQTFTTYTLYSKKFKKIYVGYSSNLIARFHSHNSLGIKGWTIKFRPWVVVHLEFFDSKASAIKREKALKSAKGRAFIWQIIKEQYE